MSDFFFQKSLKKIFFEHIKEKKPYINIYKNGKKDLTYYTSP